MVETTRTAAPRTHWARTVVLAFLAFLAIGYAVAVLVASGFSAAVDTPRSPGGVAIVVVLLAISAIVAVSTYRKGQRRGLATDALVRRVSLTLLVLAFVLFVVLGLLEGPI